MKNIVKFLKGNKFLVKLSSVLTLFVICAVLLIVPSSAAFTYNDFLNVSGYLPENRTLTPSYYLVFDSSVDLSDFPISGLGFKFTSNGLPFEKIFQSGYYTLSYQYLNDDAPPETGFADGVWYSDYQVIQISEFYELSDDEFYWLDHSYIYYGPTDPHIFLPDSGGSDSGGSDSGGSDSGGSDSGGSNFGSGDITITLPENYYTPVLHTFLVEPEDDSSLFGQLYYTFREAVYGSDNISTYQVLSLSLLCTILSFLVLLVPFILCASIFVWILKRF